VRARRGRGGGIDECERDVEAQRGCAARARGPIAPRTPDGSTEDLPLLIAPLWSALHVSRQLGVDESTLNVLRARAQVLAVPLRDGSLGYPSAQFETAGATVRVRPDLARFMHVLRRRDPWTVAILLHTPARDLRGGTPIAWVTSGRPGQALVDYAEALETQFAR
jgi:hypothetical protein